MKRTLLIPLLLLGLLLLFVFAYSQRSVILAPPAVITPTNTVPQPTQPNITSQVISPTNPAQISPSIPTTEANITVTSPQANQKVGSSFTVTGSARVFENTFQTRVTKVATQEILFNQPAMANSPDTGQFGPFSVAVTLPANLTSGDALLLEVFQYSAKDGTEIDKVTVPLVY